MVLPRVCVSCIRIALERVSWRGSSFQETVVVGDEGPLSRIHICIMAKSEIVVPMVKNWSIYSDLILQRLMIAMLWIEIIWNNFGRYLVERQKWTFTMFGRKPNVSSTLSKIIKSCAGWSRSCIKTLKQAV